MELLKFSLYEYEKYLVSGFILLIRSTYGKFGIYTGSILNKLIGVYP